MIVYFSIHTVFSFVWTLQSVAELLAQLNEKSFELEVV